MVAVMGIIHTAFTASLANFVTCPLVVVPMSHPPGQVVPVFNFREVDLLMRQW